MKRKLVRARAHGKVNVFLGVGQARPDGFHELSTVFQAVSLHDDLAVEAVPARRIESGPHVRGVRVTGLDAQKVPTDSSNLAVRAAEAVVARYRRRHGLSWAPALFLHLHKGIPTAGGMAGGSADAAAALRATVALFSPEYPPLAEEELYEIAAELGSDVPFTLMGATAWGRGRGEELTPVLSRGNYYWVFALSPQGLSTPEVFKKLDELRYARPEEQPHLDVGAVSKALVSGDPLAVAVHMHNDLEPAALHLMPRLRVAHRAAVELGALRCVVSGSGPTLAFLCRDEAAAEAVAEGLLDHNLAHRAVVAHGPVPGARVVEN
ncbi:4-(cytidine 5'-diphospho)-2-C-methyl-D-erythritol kinase [Corynebacterium sp. zg-331]|uniref:4-(cytidine 5'-diphospho)-2-C-methyl-D-erythritol kinase n=1 Tax=unclassified Corynebacterium TaxID=2624378 RepID=UPI00128CB04F|nr:MULTISPECIES: 4-(cytidine 5'-diphospho)-2-C-methyl-D-erythritol kinase [unclassified Corynebacterium]MBC3186873.1 4-(cytidine 5'-diphospho)-2-C-methyl-D-erythritol kinase [Corynebacterium sp. zg-331]MPV53353.1 4-(cytidine 5'-diphospho)-2-C-methyl-D-erythritol kinase [Corynebacterium sp. zg331]